MELIVNEGKGVGNVEIKGFFDSLGKEIGKLDTSDLPECLRDFVVEFGDGSHNGQYIYKLCVGNAELESIGDEQTLTYYNKETNGVASSLKLKESASYALGVTLCVGIFGKVFESAENPIEIVGNLAKVCIDIKDTSDNTYSLYSLAGDFRFAVFVGDRFVADEFANALGNKAKFIYNVMKIGMLPKTEKGAQGIWI